MTDRISLWGFVLAGGKSRRMGTNKALLVFHEKCLLQHMVSLIKPVCEKVFISGQNNGYPDSDVEIVSDLYLGCGPIAGVHSSLMHTVSDWNLLISVDVPFINDELLHYLISSIGESDCIIPEHVMGVEPLIGLYRKQCLPVIEESIKSGDYKLTNLLSKLNTDYVDCNHLIKKHPRLFMNINCPEDYLSI